MRQPYKEILLAIVSLFIPDLPCQIAYSSEKGASYPRKGDLKALSIACFVSLLLVCTMPLQVTLVRHGNTDANNERWLQGHVGKVDEQTNKA